MMKKLFTFATAVAALSFANLTFAEHVNINKAEIEGQIAIELAKFRDDLTQIHITNIITENLASFVVEQSTQIAITNTKQLTDLQVANKTAE